MAKIHLVDLKTGRQLAYYQAKRGAPNDPGPSLMSSGDILLDPYHGLALKIIEDGDKLTMKEHWTHKAHGGNALTVHDGVLYLGHKSMLYAYDLASGEEVPHLQSKVKRPWGLGGWKSGLVVGNRVLGVFGGGAVHKSIYRDAPYRFYSTAQFPVSSIPEGRVLSGKTDNWLAVVSKRTAPETIPQAQRFISETLNGDHLGSQDAGLPSNFSYGGPFAHGHRLLIPSLTHLYCIGPAVKGTADDDPAVAAGIAKSSDGDALLKHLTGDGANTAGRRSSAWRPSAHKRRRKDSSSWPTKTATRRSVPRRSRPSIPSPTGPERLWSRPRSKSIALRQGRPKA